MDLKTAQRELKNDILHHQALMQQLKKDPLNAALKLKLKAVQQHIAELGSKQKKLLSNIKMVNSEAKPVIDEKLSKSKAEQSSPENEPLPSYTLVAIQKESNLFNKDGGSPIGDNMPINLTIKSSKLENALVPTTALLVVTSSGQNFSNASQTSAKTVPLSISLSSLVSTGGVVTLAGGWKTTMREQQAMTGSVNSNGVPDVSNSNKLMSRKPFQIKVPVVQNPGSNSVILLPQKSVNNNQSKSLLRLLPKGHQAISQVRHAVVNGGQQHVATTSNNHASSARSSASLPTLLLTSEQSRTKTQPYQSVVVQRVLGGNPSLTSQAPSSNVMWKDLSSKTPAVHKPSYVPRKSFANMNNGVGSFQKFRILGGKAQILPKTSSQMTYTSSGPQKSQKLSMNTVMTPTNKPPSSGMVEVTRLVPTSVSRSSFYPIRPQSSLMLQSSSRNHSLINSQQLWKRDSIGCSGVQTSSFRPVSNTYNNKFINNVNKERVLGHSPDMVDNDEEHCRKVGFLRSLDLVTNEQAHKVRNRRFRKRRVAANPIYSGGMYISNELEPKRQCTSSVMLGGLDSITPPGVIVKRPRGRPRGSTKANSIASVKQGPAVRGVRNNSAPSASAACMDELRQLRGILDVVASASKAVSSAAFTNREISNSLPADADRTSDDVRTGAVSANKDDVIADAKDEEIEDGHEDQCARCGRTGEVLMCDTCSRVYHLGCTSPPLLSIPTGMWVCSQCRTEFKTTRSRTLWSGIVATVHSYVEHDGQREIAIEEEKKKLHQSKKLVMGLQLHTKSLTSSVMTKVSLRSKAKREKQVVLEDIVAIRNLVKKIRDHTVNGVDIVDK